MYSLKNKVAVVTGGASGIGAAVVKEFLREGVKHVSIWDINEEIGSTLEKQLINIYGENKVTFIKCDVTKDEQLQAAYESTYTDNEYIDIVVNNAGIADERLHMYKKEIDINLTALVTSTLKAFELMRQDKGGRGGTVINVSSAAALLLMAPSLYIYAATKAAVLHLTCSMGKEAHFSITNVRTISVCFGATMSNIYKNVGSAEYDMEELVRMFANLMPLQTTEAAAAGLVEAYKSGQSGSAWLVRKNKPALDITSKITEAYDIISKDVFE